MNKTQLHRILKYQMLSFQKDLSFILFHRREYMKQFIKNWITAKRKKCTSFLFLGFSKTTNITLRIFLEYAFICLPYIEFPDFFSVYALNKFCNCWLYCFVCSLISLLQQVLYIFYSVYYVLYVRCKHISRVQIKMETHSPTAISLTFIGCTLIKR